MFSQAQYAPEHALGLEALTDEAFNKALVFVTSHVDIPALSRALRKHDASAMRVLTRAIAQARGLYLVLTEVSWLACACLLILPRLFLTVLCLPFQINLRAHHSKGPVKVLVDKIKGSNKGETVTVPYFGCAIDCDYRTRKEMESPNGAGASMLGKLHGFAYICSCSSFFLVVHLRFFLRS